MATHPPASPDAHLKAAWRQARTPEARREAALSLLGLTKISLAWAESEVMRRQATMREAVAMCADAGVTYVEMGELLGMTNASVHRKFGPGSGS